MERIIIIGAGIGGVQTATTLATLGIESTLITNEEYDPYYRMRLAEIVTGGEPSSIAIHPYSWYEERKIKLIKGNVISIYRISHTIRLDDGSVIPYTKLVIATGTNALSFPIKGIEDNAFVLRKMEDAILLCEKLKTMNSGSLTIIGGGLLGLESAVSISEHYKIKVNVIESQEYILSKQIDRDSSSFIKRELEERGISIYESSAVEEYRDGKLMLSSGIGIPTDMILFSIGVRSNLSFLDDSGINTNRGIIVDSHLRTNDCDIYALGDSAELNGKCFSLAMYAREQGIFIANSISGNEAVYVPSEISSNVKLAGMDISFFGNLEGEPIVIEKDKSRISCFIEDGIVKAVVLINAKSFVSKAKNTIGKAFNDKDFILN